MSVNVNREDVRVCDRCKAPHPTGIIGIAEIRSVRLDESSVRTVAGMEMMFGPGHEKLAAVMAPPITATEGTKDRKVLCVSCFAGVMAAMEPEEVSE